MARVSTAWRRIAVPALLASVFLAAGCGTGGNTADAETAPATPDIAAIVDDLNAYWAEADADLGFDYTAVPLERVGTAADGVTCDGRPIKAEDVEGNAFVDSGCSEGLLVAFDPAYVGASLARAEVTMAHEWGHVIQAQAQELDLSEDPEGLPIDAELQADCFAGAWAAERAEADISRLRKDLAGAGDPDEVDIEDPHAHGTPRERAAAFDVGVRGGPAACVDEIIDALP